METLVVDASIAIKWVVQEEGTDTAWKKAVRGELTCDEAIMAARLLERSGIDFLPMTGLLEEATSLAIELSHPAYDCAYLTVARRTGSRFVTADARLLRIVAERASPEIAGLCVSLPDVRNGTH